jgi:hypothetical protein
MNKETIEQLIQNANGDVFFAGKAGETKVKEIETLLSVTLPDSYKWFLKELGHGGVSGLEIIGNGLGEIPACVKSTKSWRAHGLPLSLVVIEDEGTDWIYCLDTYRLSDDECPVVDWTPNEGIGKEVYTTFFDFFRTRLEETINSNH